MTSRLADSEQLAERCRKAGWQVDRSPNGGGYKVWDPTGQMHSIHLTYSHIYSLNLVTKQLEKAGLNDAEAVVARTRLTESRTRMQVAREAAEKKAQAMVAKASVTKAAGPYLIEAEQVPVEWFTMAHPRPWMRWAHVTPEIAKIVLEDFNGDNRPLDMKSVAHYVRIIEAKLWHLTHQGVAFDTRGLLQDGQHRFTAILQVAKNDSDFTGVPFACFVGMPEENFKAIDEGKLRTARQLFGKAGEKYAGPLQTCVRLVHYLNDGDARRSVRLRLPNQVILDEFTADEDEFRTSTKYGAVNYSKVGLSSGALAASHYILRKLNGADNPYVDHFFTGYIYGTVPGTRLLLDDTDPRAVLRRVISDLRLKGNSRTSLTQVGMVITSWNNCVMGRNPRSLPFNDDNTIPQVLLSKPGEGATPTAFQDGN